MRQDMIRNFGIGLAALCIAALGACVASANNQPVANAPSGNGAAHLQGEDAGQPNIVFIITDDMYPHMFNNLPEGEGKNLTPNIDYLIENGSFLHNTYVSSPVCTPSRYAVLTGNYASRASNPGFTSFTAEHDGQTVIQWNTKIEAGDRRTIGARLQQLGYRTGFVGKNHVVESAAQGGQDRAWNLDGDPTDPAIKADLERRHAALAADIRSVGFDFADRLYHDNPNWLGMRALAFQNMDWITEGGINFIRDSAAQDTPFFLYFATTLPHAPTEPERSWRADPRITPIGILDKAPAVQPGRDTLAARVRDAGLSRTGRENLLWVDDAIGALLEALRSTGQIDNTIIVLFNDHGQNEKGTLYNGGIRTQAFIWRSRGFGCGENCNFTISNTDFADTLVDLAGGDPEAVSTDGSSFADALETGRREASRSMYFELGYARAVVMGDWKYLALRYPRWAEEASMEERRRMLDEYNAMRRSFGRNIVTEDHTQPYGHLEMTPGGGDAENGTYRTRKGLFARDQLYNIARDPAEAVNLADDPEYADVLARMRAEMVQYAARLPGNFAVEPAE